MEQPMAVINLGTVSRTTLLSQWSNAISGGTFLTWKHDPASIGSGCPTFRSITLQSQIDLGQFLGLGNYDIHLYENTKKPMEPFYISIEPHDKSMVPGSGIKPFSSIPTSSCDRFVVVSGAKQGWHIYAENDTQIKVKESAGDLLYVGRL